MKCDHCGHEPATYVHASGKHICERCAVDARIKIIEERIYELQILLARLRARYREL